MTVTALKHRTILIAGGTGMLGTQLAKTLVDGGYHVVILSRNPETLKQKETPEISFAKWDIANKTIDQNCLQHVYALVNLAGAGVMDKAWTKDYKNEIVSSRVESSALLLKALQSYKNTIEIVISTSAVGWYGESKTNRAFVESDEADTSFLGQTCLAWENAITPVIDLKKRLVIFRTGIVLSNAGGAFVEFKKSLKFRVASILGNGKQIVSWIHADDWCSMIVSAIENDTMVGIYNAVAPQPVDNNKLTTTLAKTALGKGYVPLHVPTAVLKLMLGERSIEILKSANVSAKKILETGFTFKFPNIQSAINDLVNTK